MSSLMRWCIILPQRVRKNGCRKEKYRRERQTNPAIETDGSLKMQDPKAKSAQKFVAEGLQSDLPGLIESPSPYCLGTPGQA